MLREIANDGRVVARRGSYSLGRTRPLSKCSVTVRICTDPCPHADGLMVHAKPTRCCKPHVHKQSGTTPHPPAQVISSIASCSPTNQSQATDAASRTAHPICG